MSWESRLEPPEYPDRDDYCPDCNAAPCICDDDGYDESIEEWKRELREERGGEG